MAYYLGLDIGTTGTKAMLYSPDCKLVSSSYAGYEVVCPASGYTEQNPMDWYAAICQTVRECAKTVQKEKVFISISAQGGALVLADSDGSPIRPAISWLDRRAGEEAEYLTSLHDKDYYYKNTGWRLNDGYNLAEILWLKRNERSSFDKASYFLTPLDWVNMKLTGIPCTDFTNLGITNLENIRTNTWLDSIWDDIGIEENQLPVIKPSGYIIGSLTEEASMDLGLENAVVVNGGYDQFCGALGLGAVSTGDLMLSTGTSWVILGVSDHLLFDTNSYISPCSHVVPGKYVTMASLETGGISLEWYRKISSTGDLEDFKTIDKHAFERKASEDGLFFIPYLAGATCPYWSKSSRGSFVGLQLSHDHYHIARAVMEGVAYEARCIVSAFNAAGFSPSRIKLVGGAAKSSLWTGIIADTLQLEVDVYGNANAACIGAAVLAAYGSTEHGDDMVAIQTMFDSGFNTISPKRSKKEAEELQRGYE